MKKPRIAIISFPGTNGDTENLRTFQRTGFEAFVFRWNDAREKLEGVDGYFIGAGFAYEDRGRSGMVAARDPLFRFLHEEAARGKVVLGNCNGAQVLVESGLIPLGSGLRMSLARNAIRASTSPLDSARGSAQHDIWFAPGFLNEWISITRTCARDRCATSDFDGVLRIPMAHGEGRYVTKDPDLIAALEAADQIAFRYCDAAGAVSEDPSVTPNGSTGAIAGICNPGGNVVALMPHPERTVNGDPYFLSLKKWMERKSGVMPNSGHAAGPFDKLRTGCIEASLPRRAPRPLEIFIDTIIVNNEERTVEQAARRIAPKLRLKQYRYLAPTRRDPEEILTTIALFNPNKEFAYVRREGRWFRWDASGKMLKEARNPLAMVTLLRRDEPDTGAGSLGEGSETGICYSCGDAAESDAARSDLQEIFGNPHASVLERMVL